MLDSVLPVEGSISDSDAVPPSEWEDISDSESEDDSDVEVDIDTSGIISAISDFHDDFQESLIPPDYVELDGIDVAVDSDIIASPSFAARRSSASDYPDNMIVFEGIFNGDQHVLYLPVQYYDDISIIDGKLYNISNNSFFGRFDTLDMVDYEISTYTLGPCIGNPNNVYRNGYYNYSTSYYDSGSSLRSNTTYGDFTVTDVLSHHSSSSDDKVHFDLLVLIVLVGVMLLCYWKRLRKL